MKIKESLRLLFNDSEGFIIALFTKFPFLISDRKFILKKYKFKVGKNLNIDNPETFNEKLQWLKLYYRKPVLTELVDKIRVKDYVASRIGDQYIIPTLGVWNSFEEIDFGALPDQFVLKTNHDYGGVIICKDKKRFDYQSSKRILDDHLRKNFYYVGREWAYKDVEPKILAEKYIGELGDDEASDYKFYCFNGEPKLLLISSGRQSREGKMTWNFSDV